LEDRHLWADAADSQRRHERHFRFLRGMAAASL